MPTENKTQEEPPAGAATGATGATGAADPAAESHIDPAKSNAQTGAEAKAKTCVEPMNAAPTEDGDYVMFDGTNYTVFNLPAKADMLTNVADGAKFFKVLPDETKGGKRKSRKSAKKQRKSAKKQHKSAKKQRKSRGSRRSKK